MDVDKGFIIGEISDSKRGKENLAKISLNIAGKLYDMMPYNGRVIKTKEKGIIVNLGLLDGIKTGSQLIVYRNIRSRSTNDIMRTGELLTVKEADTFISYAEPDRAELLNEVDSTVKVFPLKNRRAKKIE